MVLNTGIALGRVTLPCAFKALEQVGISAAIANLHILYGIIETYSVINELGVGHIPAAPALGVMD